MLEFDGTRGPPSPDYALGVGALDSFSPATRGWFERTFAAPTPAQELGWPAIATGRARADPGADRLRQDADRVPLALDRLSASPGKGLRVLYVSPLKALNYDIERNLRGPLAGLESTLRVAVRTGDTPAKERRELIKEPPDILITTPESLYLMLTSQARETLRGVETLILDEVHAVAGTKRGSHLALSVERLEALVRRAARSASGSPRHNARSRRSAASSPAAARSRSSTRARARSSTSRWSIPVEDMRELGSTASLSYPVPADGQEMDRRRRARHAVDLAVDLPGAPAPRARAPLDDRVRQQPPARRAARAAPQRARERRAPTARRSSSRAPTTARSPASSACSSKRT